MENEKNQENPYKDYLLLSRCDFCNEEVWQRVLKDLGIINEEFRYCSEEDIFIVVKESGRVY